MILTVTSLNPCFSGTYSQSVTIIYDHNKGSVLILVLVEHTLRVDADEATGTKVVVLILVLVEHTLRVTTIVWHAGKNAKVLILVLVEHTLRGWSVVTFKIDGES